MSRPRQETIERCAAVVLGAALACGLGGAFVGLTTSSYWYDELFTAWVTGGDGGAAGLAQRISLDTHPPIYYLAAGLVTAVLGHADVVLRGFSALCAGAAVLVLLASLRHRVSAAGLCFAGVLATSSRVWVFQSQNARNYALVMLGLSVMIGLALRLEARLAGPRRPVGGTVVGLVAAAALVSFTHFYGMYAALFILVACALRLPSVRWPLMAAAVGIAVAAQAYVALVIHRFSGYTLSVSWIGNGRYWFVRQTREALGQSLSISCGLALAVCGAAAAVGARRPVARWLRERPGIAGVRAVGRRLGQLPLIDMLPLFGPPAVLAVGVASSYLLAPNVTARNLLVCAPFLWLGAGRLFDAGLQSLKGSWRPALVVIVTGLSVVSAGVVTQRSVPRNEDWRAAAALANADARCRGAPVMVIINEPAAWSRADFRDRFIASVARHYDARGVRPVVALLSDVMAGRFPSVMADRLHAAQDPRACPVVAEWLHGIDAGKVGAVGRQIGAVSSGGGRPVQVDVRAFHVRLPDGFGRSTRDDFGVVYVLRP